VSLRLRYLQANYFPSRPERPRHPSKERVEVWDISRPVGNRRSVERTALDPSQVRRVSEPVLDARHRPLLCRPEHLAREIYAEHVPIRPDPSSEIPRQGPRATREIQSPPTGTKLGGLHCFFVPDAVKPCGHQRVQELVAVRDPVEHLPHKPRPLLGRGQVALYRRPPTRAAYDPTSRPARDPLYPSRPGPCRPRSPSDPLSSPGGCRSRARPRPRHPRPP
jgi:hypothetical protein